jgi:hypothetical protein
VAFAGHPESKENRTDGTADLHLPLYCRNAREPLNVVIHFSKDRHWIQTDDAHYRDSTGNLEFRQEILCLDKENSQALNIHLPSNLVSEKYRKTKAKVELFNSSGEIVESFTSFDVHFPKNNGREPRVTLASRTQAPALRRSEASVQKTNHSEVATSTAVTEAILRSDRVEKPASATLNYVKTMPATMVSRERASGFTSGIVRSDDSANGVKMIECRADSPVGKAGLVSGDVIMAVDGKPVKTRLSLDAELENRLPNSKVSLTFMHTAWVMNATVTIGSRAPDSGIVWGLLFP